MCKEYDLLIDGGTSNTRFTLMDHGNLIADTAYPVGASQAEKPAENDRLAQTVKKVLFALQNRYQCRITNVYASGMLTSGAGLCEIPHINAPAGFRDLAGNIQIKKLPDISPDALFHFIPGIRFTQQPETGPDMMRGEEVEIFGALRKEDYDKSIMFLHFGSHHKLIHYRDHAIQNAVTTLSGELFWAVIHNTILKSSVGNLQEPFEIAEKYVKMGYEETGKNGISRSLFAARILQVMEKATENQVLSYLYGALMYTDLQAFSRHMNQTIDKFIIYGRKNFLHTFRYCLAFLEIDAVSDIEIEEIPFPESEQLSVKGCQLIRDYYETNRQGAADE